MVVLQFLITLMNNPPSLSPEVLVPRLGDSLIEQGLISREQLEIALSAQQKAKNSKQQVLLGQVLIDLGFIERPQLDQVVTEQIVNLRNALQKANEELEERVRQRTAELEIAYKKLSELNLLKSNFIANISHELRTPMTHIKGYLELLFRRDLGELNPEQSSAMDVLLASSNHLEKLISDLILFTMMERGNVALDLQSVHLHQLLETLLLYAHDQVQAKGLIMEVDIDPQDVEIEADQDKISWALKELIANAIKFTPTKGSVKLSSQVQKDLASISIIDTGIGIPADRINEAFQPFHQLDGSSTRSFSGTGIGLSLAKAIIQAHGSEIEISSNQGHGMIVTFSLKIKQGTSN
jgi:signal transduction histidine kinase